MNELDASKSAVWSKALVRLRVGRLLYRELQRTCPDSQVDPEGARANSAARTALGAAIDIVRHNQPTKKASPILDGHWAGVVEAACRIITAIELDMYDPRSHPERYK